MIKNIPAHPLILLVFLTQFFLACIVDTPTPPAEIQTVKCLKNSDCPDKFGCYSQLQKCVSLTKQCIKNNGEQLLTVVNGDTCTLDNGIDPICLSGECKESKCGDNFFNKKTEECDDNNKDNLDGCTNACKLSKCGDGFLQNNEICDDGNLLNGDGCTKDCLKIERCGDSIVDEGEECDDGNQNKNDLCDLCSKVEWTSSVITGLGASKGNPLESVIKQPLSVTLALDNSFYIATKCQIFKISNDGQYLTTYAGQEECGFSGDGGNASSAQFNRIKSISITNLNELFIVDQGNHRIRKIDTKGIVTTIAGTAERGFSGDGGPAVLAQIDLPGDLFIDGETLYFSDRFNHRIRKIDAFGIITTIAGTGEEEGGLYNAPALEVDLLFPDAVFVADGVVYFTDNFNESLCKIDANGILKEIKDISGAYGGSPTIDLFVENNNIYILDSNDQMLVKILPNGETKVLIAAFDSRVNDEDEDDIIVEEPVDDYPLTDDDTIIHPMLRPQSLFIQNDEIYYANTENNTVEKLNINHEISIIAGMPIANFSNQVDIAENIPMNGFQYFSMFEENIYFSDFTLSGLRKLNVNNGQIEPVPGTNKTDFEDSSGLIVTNGHFDLPAYYATNNNLFINDIYNGSIRKIDASGEVSTVLGSEIIDEELAAIFIENDILYYATENYIKSIDTSGVVTTILGTLDEYGYYIDGFLGDGGPATDALISGVSSIFVHQGIVYIADTWNQRIRKIDENGIITTIAGTGEEGFTEDGQLAITSNINYPSFVYVYNEEVYFAETENSTIRKINQNGQLVTIAGTGQIGYSGDGGLAINAQLNYPSAFHIYNDKMYIADQRNRRIRVIDENGIITTLAGNYIKHRSYAFETGLFQNPESLTVFNNSTLLSANSLFNQSKIIDFMKQKVHPLVGFEGGFEIDEDPYSSAPQKYNTRTEFMRLLNYAAGIAYDGIESIYISEKNSGTILIVNVPDINDSATWSINTYAGSQDEKYHQDGDLSSARFDAPTGLYYDINTAFLYVIDSGSHTLRVIDTIEEKIETRAGEINISAPYPGYLQNPSALTLGTDNSIFISDTLNHRVVRIAPDGTESVVLGTGEAASSGDGIPAFSFPVDRPKSLVVDSFGNLYVTSSKTIRMVTANDAGVVDGNGQVITLYGKSPRESFPENTTQCLSGMVIRDTNIINFTDICSGLLLEMVRK